MWTGFSTLRVICTVARPEFEIGCMKSCIFSRRYEMRTLKGLAGFFTIVLYRWNLFRCQCLAWKAGTQMYIEWWDLLQSKLPPRTKLAWIRPQNNVSEARCFFHSTECCMPHFRIRFPCLKALNGEDISLSQWLLLCWMGDGCIQKYFEGFCRWEVDSNSRSHTGHFNEAKRDFASVRGI